MGLWEPPGWLFVGLAAEALAVIDGSGDKAIGSALIILLFRALDSGSGGLFLPAAIAFFPRRPCLIRACPANHQPFLSTATIIAVVAVALAIGIIFSGFRL